MSALRYATRDGIRFVDQGPATASLSGFGGRMVQARSTAAAHRDEQARYKARKAAERRLCHPPECVRLAGHAGYCRPTWRVVRP